MTEAQGTDLIAQVTGMRAEVLARQNVTGALLAETRMYCGAVCFLLLLVIGCQVAFGKKGR